METSSDSGEGGDRCGLVHQVRAMGEHGTTFVRRGVDVIRSDVMDWGGRGGQLLLWATTGRVWFRLVGGVNIFGRWGRMSVELVK